MRDNERALRKMSIGDIIDYSIEIYKRNFKKLTLLALIFYVPFSFLFTLISSYIYSDLLESTGYYKLSEGFGIFKLSQGFFSSGLFDPNILNNDSASITYMILAYYTLMIVMGLLYFAYSITLKVVLDASAIKIVYSDVVNNKETDARSVIRESFKKFPSLVANKVLYGLIILGIILGVYIVLVVVILILTFGIMAAAGPTAANQTGSTIAGILTVIAILLVILGCALLAAFLAVKFSFGLQAVVIENKGPVEGLSRSSRLTRKNFWPVFGAYFFGTLLFFAIPSILASGAGIFLLVHRYLYIVLSVTTQVVNAIIYPFLITLLTMIFINLKIKKEGLDLEVKVDILLEEQKKRDDGELSGEL